VPQSGHDSLVDHYTANIVTGQDYYPGGMLMQGRQVQNNYQNYRYGFNSQENDDEIKGQSNSLGAKYWEYDPRVGRRWNLDPRHIPGISPYAAFNNNPIFNNDSLGDTSVPVMPRYPITKVADLVYAPYNLVGTAVNTVQALGNKAADYVKAFASGAPVQSVGDQISSDASAVKSSVVATVNYYANTPKTQIAADAKNFFTNPDNYFKAAEQTILLVDTWELGGGETQTAPDKPSITDNVTTVEPAAKGAPKPTPKFKIPTNPPQLPIKEIPEGMTIRVMRPTEQFPDGYWRLEKPMCQGGAQGINPLTMKPGTLEETHVPLPPGYWKK
jgi:hypothetical protein